MRALGIAVLSVVAGAAGAAGAGDVPTLVWRPHGQAERLWKDMPEDPQAKSVRLVGGTTPACAGPALRRAKAALGAAPSGPLALRTLGVETALEPGLTGGYRVRGGQDVAALQDAWLEADDAEAFVLALRPRAGTRITPERLAAAERDARVLYDRLGAAGSTPHAAPASDADCGSTWSVLDLRALPGGKGKLQLTFAVEGNCGCRAPAEAPAAQRARAWRVVGTTRLAPDQRSNDGKRHEVRFKADDPDYAVFAVCGCAEEEQQAEEPPPAVALPAAAAGVAAACGQRCAALQPRVQERLREAARAGQDAELLEGRSQRLSRELAALKKTAPRKPKGKPTPKARKALETAAAALGKKEAEAREAQGAAALARQQADYLQGAATEAVSSFEGCYGTCPPAGGAAVASGGSGQILGLPKYAVIGGGAAVVLGLVVLAGGDSSGEAGEPSSVAVSPSGSAPVDKSGTYAVSITVESDPGNHEAVIGLRRVTQLRIVAAAPRIEFIAAEPWVTLPGTFDGERFDAATDGTVAGRGQVGVGFTGTLCTAGLNGRLGLGLGGELPGGQAVFYRVIGSRIGP
jgi:hypothetical protein